MITKIKRNTIKLLYWIHQRYPIMSKLKKIYIGSWYYLFRIFPIEQHKIVFINYFGKGFGDNGKYIAEEIIRQNLNFDLVWIVSDNKNLTFPNSIRNVKNNSLRAIYELTTAKIWINNCRMDINVEKRKGQFYIQTWHGGIPLKRIEKDVESKLTKGYVELAKHDSEMADLFISKSKFCTELYHSAFWYVGEILECGFPRNDILIRNPKDIKHRVLSFFGLDDINIVLYAPTFRVDYNLDGYKLKFNNILTELENKHGCKWLFLVRLHPNMAHMQGLIPYNDQIINATQYDDMQELMVASDILITDYSSTMFEFMLMQKPVLLYVTDLKDYVEDRDLYFDVFSLPFLVAESDEKIIDCIKSFDDANYKTALTAFNNEVVLHERGTASEKVVERIKIEVLS